MVTRQRSRGVRNDFADDLAAIDGKALADGVGG
jgi:hypothetical protein